MKNCMTSNMVVNFTGVGKFLGLQAIIKKILGTLGLF